MTLISFAGRIRVRPEVSFHHCASEERMRDTIDLTRVCTGFSYNLKLSNLSHLGRMLLKPRRKRPLYQDSHPKERSGSEDSVGAWCSDANMSSVILHTASGHPAAFSPVFYSRQRGAALW